MYTRAARSQTAATHWARQGGGIAQEPVTSWQPVLPEAPVAPRQRPDLHLVPAERPAPVPILKRSDVRLRQTVLLVSRQADVRRELRAWLQEHPKLRVVEVNSVSTAVTLASEVAVHLIIADTGSASITRQMPDIQTILLADGPAGIAGVESGPRRHVMQRPFSPETLVATVLLMLQEPIAAR